MTVRDLEDHLRQHWPTIRDQLLQGTYQPQPVKRVEIPKPDGGVRKPGISTVLDRFIQQAMLQVLQRDWDRTFSGGSYGFRPGRSAHHAITAAQGFIAEGYRWVVDLDLEKLFDRVNHDILMSRIAKRVRDVRVLLLIRAFLNAGVLENGLVTATDEGTPQGGPLSPWLSSVMLDDLARELERRGLKFARYADDLATLDAVNPQGVLHDLNASLHRRLRAVVWKQWKTSRRRFSELRRLGVSRDLAAQTVGSCHGPWRLSKSPALHKALPTQFFQQLGLVTLHPAAPAA